VIEYMRAVTNKYGDHLFEFLHFEYVACYLSIK
jgi:hypothetical protein